MYVSEVTGDSDASACVIEVFGNPNYSFIDGLHYKHSKSFENLASQFTELRNLGHEKKMDSKAITDLRGDFSLWDARMGRGIPTQLST